MYAQANASPPQHSEFVTTAKHVAWNILMHSACHQSSMFTQSVIQGVWHDSQVLYNDLPIYVTPELADTIAFVGRAVRMLKTRAAGFSGQDLLPFK